MLTHAKMDPRYNPGNLHPILGRNFWKELQIYAVLWAVERTPTK